MCVVDTIDGYLRHCNDCSVYFLPSCITVGARALLDISSVPTLNDVSELILTQIAAKWQSVALWLGVEGFFIDIISTNHPKDCEGACRDMLKHWLRKERYTGQEKRTWSALLTILGKAGFVDLENSLRREQFKVPYEL